MVTLWVLVISSSIQAIPHPFEPAYIPAREYGSAQVFELDKVLQASTTPQADAYTTKKEIFGNIETPEISFSSVGLTWNEYVPANTSATIAIRFFQNSKWTDWNIAPRDIDHKETDESELTSDGLQDAFLSINPATAYQYKIILLGNGNVTPTIKNIKITLINAKDDPAVLQKIASSGSHLTAEITQDMISPERVKIISRAEWGANESLRVYKGDLAIPPVQKLDSDYQDKYSDELQIVRKVTTNEKGELLSWPQEYPAKVSKIIIHHTASTANLDDPKKALRDIYYWHAIGRGWGDIGYNYIIDPQGNIYEGRAGGEMVIGAHGGKANTGSIGISVMGNYETGDVSDASLVALTRLISEKTKIHDIDPTGKSVFRGQMMPNVLGHRDVMSTSCPGQKLYDKLPLIAQLAKSSISTTVEGSGFQKQKKQGYDFEDKSGILYVDLNPDQSKDLTIQIKNTGTVTWNADTSIVVNDFESMKDFVQVITPTSRVTFPMQQPRTIAPGDTTTFMITIAGGFRSSLKTLGIAPIINGKTKLDKRIEIPTQTAAAQFTYDLVSTSSVPSTMKVGQAFTYTVDLKNTGNVNWENKGSRIVRMGTEKPRDRRTLFLTPSSGRAGFLEQAVVRPGEVGHFIFNLTAPKIADIYEEHFAPVVEGVSWMGDKGIYFKTFVYESEYGATPVSTGVIDAIQSTTQMSTIRLRNVGSTTWTTANQPQFKRNGTSRLSIVSSVMQESQVAPSETGTFTVQISVPKFFQSGKIKVDAYMNTTRMTSKSLTITAKKYRIPKVKPNTIPTFTPPNNQSSTSSLSTFSSTSSKGTPVRVLLGYSGTPIISGDGSFTVKSGSYTASFSKDTKVTVQPQNGSYEILANNFFQIVDDPVQFIPQEGTILRVDNWTRGASWDSKINDNEFRGMLEVRMDGTTTNVINELPIEDYLKGLAETLNGDPVEKKKAIVVAARNYVLYYSTVGKGTKFPGKPYDIDDNPEHSQKYMGYGYEKRSPLSVKSVDDTAGIIIKYQGNVVRAPYFSSDDGRTRGAAETWGWKNADFLISVDDPYCAGMSMAGHGVGMSGCGSLAMAKNGKSYQGILHYYYQNVTIEKVW